MTEKFLSALKAVYGTAAVPAAVADKNLAVLWRNTAADAEGNPLKCDNISWLSESGSLRSGMTCCTKDGRAMRFNIIKTADPDDNSVCYIAEHVGTDAIAALQEMPEIKGYMTYLCARIRESAGMIAISADEIESAAAVLGAGCWEVTERLNTINKGLMLILREVVAPEQFYYTVDPDCEDTLICVSDETGKAASDAGRALGENVKITRSLQEGIYIRMNRNVFETLLAGMTADCCCGEYSPDELVFSCEKTPDGRASVEVRSICGTENRNIVSKFERDRKNSRFYYDSLCDVIREKYGAEITEEKLPDGISCRLRLKAEKSDRMIVKNASKYAIRPERFCTMTLSLAEHHLEERYRFINIDNGIDAVITQNIRKER